MKMGGIVSAVAVAALVAATPVSAQSKRSATAQPEPQAEHVEAVSELRGRGLLFGLVGAGVVILLLLLLTGEDGDAEPLPGPPPVSP